jgi:glycosyltransferase involved in cell wall biosynthesis
VRILAISNRYPPWSIGGYEAIAAGAIGALRTAGHTVRVLTTRPDPSDRDATSEDPDLHRELRWYWHNHEFPELPLRSTIASERSNARVLRTHLRAFRPEAVLWWAMGGMSLSVLEQVRRAGVPAVGVVGDDWMVYAPKVDRWTRLWRGRRKLAAALAERLAGVPAGVDLDRAARWVFISRYTLDTARGTGLRLSEATVIHPGVDPRRFEFREPEPWAWRLLYCGRIDARKGIATAIEALGGLPTAMLTIDGDGDRRHLEELEELAHRLGVAERVIFRSSQHSAVADAYAAADAVVFPVRWREPWGLVPLEAMATGRPVLASQAGGGAAEYLRDGENCLQFAPGDAGALASVLQRLAADAGLREQLVEGGRQTAASVTAARFHELLQGELEQALRDA